MCAQSNLDIRALRANQNIPARNYWRARLQGFEWETGEVPLKPSTDTYTLEMPLAVSQKLQDLAAHTKARHIVLLGALGIFMHKYAQQSEVVIFTPGYAAEQPDAACNLFPVRINRWTGLGFRDYLAALKDQFLQDLSHAGYPLHKILNKEKEEIARLSVAGILLPSLHNAQAFDGMAPRLLFSVGDERQPVLTIRYDNQQYDAASVAQVGSLYCRLLERLIDHKEEDIAGISLLSKEEEQEVLYEFNDTFYAYATEDTVISLWEKQVALHTGKTALWCDDQSVSYQELHELSNSLAAWLHQQGVQRGDLVGIMLDREKMLVPVILALLQLGAAYVPLDPANPSGRLQSILHDAGIGLVITRSQYFAAAGEQAAAKMLNLDKVPAGKDIQVNLAASHRPSPHDLAYVIYTSGSTGVPNGVKISHGALFNYISWAAQQYAGTTGADFALYSSIAFDLTVTSIFVPLVTGNAMHVFRGATAHHLLIEEVIAADRAAVVKLTPAHLRIIRDSDLLKAKQPAILTTLIVGGEQLDSKLARDIYDMFGGKVTIYNEYGPTEATVGCMIYRYDPADDLLSVPVGRPIHNTKIYLLDSLLRPVPEGVQGELYIGGKGLAEGYLQRESLTQQKFISNPYVAGEKIYKTGDLAIRVAKTKILYRGRVDEQVKINGYRVEPGEIGSLLKTYEAIEEAVVVHKEIRDNNCLVAYYTASYALDVAAIKEFLERRLPPYMVPAWYLQLDHMPLTFNGKVDRKALPDPAVTGKDVFIAPRTPEEELLANTWMQVLGFEAISATSNFFSLGGDSIKSIQVISRVRSAGYEISIDDIFSLKTVEALAAKIKSTKRPGGVEIAAGNLASAVGEIPPTPLQPHYPLSAAQGRLWVVSQFEEGNTAYNMRAAYECAGHLNRKALEQAFHRLIDRHESLRTVFKPSSAGEIRQFVLDPVATGFELVYVDLSDTGSPAEQVKQQVQAAVGKPFNLATGPLLRAELYRIAPDRWVFVYVMHHIISDGWSVNVLINELIVLYNAFAAGREMPLQPLAIQYRDFTAWQQQQLSGERLAAHRRYWQEHLKGPLPVLKLPVNKVRPPVKSYEGATIEQKINEEVTRAIKQLGEQQGCTLFMSLLAAVRILLYKYTGQEDMVIGTPVAGREHQDLEGQIGFYLNTLALRTQCLKEDSYNDLLQHIKQVTLGAYRHQDYPFDILLGDIDWPADTSRSPLFDVMVALQNTNTLAAAQPREAGGLVISRYEEAENRVSTFDLTFDFIEANGSLIVSIEYNTGLFYPATAQLIASQLADLFAFIARHPETRVDEIDCPGIGGQQHLRKAGNKIDLINDLEF